MLGLYPEIEPYDHGMLPVGDGNARIEAGGSRWYWWVLGGVALAAAAGGTAFGVMQATQKPAGNVSVSW